MLDFWQRCTRVLIQVNRLNANMGKSIAGLLLAAMVVMVIAQVAFRYIANDSLTWTEELAKFAMVWIACLVAPWAYLNHLNVAVDIFHSALPIKIKRLAEIVITLVILLTCYQFFVYSLAFLDTGRSMMAASVPLSLFYIYLCLPYLFGSLFSIAVEKLVLQLRTITEPSTLIAATQCDRGSS